MNTIKSLLFDDPTLVCVVAGIVFLVLAWVYLAAVRRGWAGEAPSKRLRSILLSGLIAMPFLGGMVVVLDVLIESDREQIVRISREIAEDVETGDLQAILPHLDSDFQARWRGKPLSRDEVTEAIQAERESNSISGIKIGDVKLDISGQRAKMFVTTTMQVKAEMTINVPLTLTWDMQWVKRPDGWKIRTVRETRFGL